MVLYEFSCNGCGFVCRCACVSGFLKRFCGTVQWTVFAAATAAMFTVSLVGAVGNALSWSYLVIEFNLIIDQ